MACGKRGRRTLAPGRATVTILLLLAGAACLSYGVAFHSVPVLPKPDTSEEEVPETPPEILPEDEVGFTADELFGPPSEDAPPLLIDLSDGPEPGVEMSEREVLHEVTIGGLERLPSGRLMRTYVLGETPPSFCPT